MTQEQAQQPSAEVDTAETDIKPQLSEPVDNDDPPVVSLDTEE